MCSEAAQVAGPVRTLTALSTPQFVKETLQWGEKTQLVWILFGSWERQKLSEGVPQRPLKKRHWITKVMLHLILTRILCILGSLTRNKKRQWHLR